MQKEHIFPLILILLDLCAAAVYGFSGDWKKAVYWAAAVVLNAAVTF